MAAAMALFAVVFWWFHDVMHWDFLHWDDDDYIAKNPYITRLTVSNIAKLFTTFYAANWHPVTWLSHALDIALFGKHPAGPHTVNLILHCVNTVLLFVLTITVLVLFFQQQLAQGQLKNSYRKLIVVALLTSLWFGIHPLRVESFAWISERKDVLCLLFVLLSTIFYLFRFLYPHRNRQNFITSFVFFMLAVMSKGMAVTLPIILLALDVFPGITHRFENFDLGNVIRSKTFRVCVYEKIPYLLVSLTAGILIILAQHDAGAIKSIESINPGIRLLNAANSLFVYLSKTLLPTQLLPIYPYPEHVQSLNVMSFTQVAVVLTLIGVSIYLALRRKPQLLLFVAIYIVLLAPVLGLLQVGEQPYADRYSYLPTLPFYIVIAVLMTKITITSRNNSRGNSIKIFAAYLIIGIFIIGAMLRSTSYVKIWQNDFTLWSYVINNSKTPAIVAYNNLGVRYKDEKNFAEAEKILLMGMERYPKNGALYGNLRTVYELTRQYQKELALVEKLEKISGSSKVYYMDKAHAYIQMHRYSDALAVLRPAIEAYPDNEQLQYQAAYCHAELGQYDKSLKLLNGELLRNTNSVPIIELRKKITALMQKHANHQTPD